MDKIKQEKKELQRKQENAALNKLLLWFGAAIVYEIIALLTKRYFVNFNSVDIHEVNIAVALSNLFKVLRFVGPAVMVVGVVWCWMWQKQDKSKLLPAICIWIGAAAGLTSIAAYQFGPSGVSALGFVAPVVAILALVYFLYQKEFFCNTALTGVAVGALWVYRKAYPGHGVLVYFSIAMALILMIAGAYLVWKLDQNKGSWKGMQIFTDKTNYLPCYVTVALGIVALLATLLAGTTVAYYAIFVLIAWLFCMAVYYTVCMM